MSCILPHAYALFSADRYIGKSRARAFIRASYARCACSIIMKIRRRSSGSRNLTTDPSDTSIFHNSPGFNRAAIISVLERGWVDLCKKVRVKIEI